MSDLPPEFVKEYREYVTDSYESDMDLSALDDEYREKLESVDVLNLQNMRRVERLAKDLKYSYTFNKLGTVTSCFRIIDKGVNAIYGYIHSFKEFESTNGKNNTVTHAAIPPIEHQYVCACPTYTSMDGEFRSRLIPYAQFMACMEIYKKELEPVEQMVVDKINAGAIFNVEVHQQGESVRNLLDNIDCKRLAIKLYMATWFCEIIKLEMDYQENHIHEEYSFIIDDEESHELFWYIISEIGYDKYIEIFVNLSKYRQNVRESPTPKQLELECGQKFIPVSYSEATNIEDIKYGLWREIYITVKASNNVINGICPSFPLYNDYFFIRHQDAKYGHDLYDNNAMHVKYEQSKTAEELFGALKSADKYNYVNEKPLNSQFSGISQSLRKSLNEINKDLRLTDLTLCMTLEYVGRTLADMPKVVKQKEASVGIKDAFTQDLFIKHMFEYIYGFYCLNTKSHALHGDPHMNNITMYCIGHVRKPDHSMLYKNPTVVYVVGKNTYSFKHYGVVSGIIDFSRSIIGSYEMIKQEYSAQYADEFFKSQQQDLFQIFFNKFPDFVTEHAERIQELLRDSFELMFKILTAIDVYTVFTNINIFMNTTVKSMDIPLPPFVSQLENISKYASNFIIDKTTDAINCKIRFADDIEWPNRLMLEEFFSKFRFDPSVEQNIIDIYCYNNEFKYTMDDRDNYGPIVSIEKIFQLFEKYKITPPPEYQRWLNYKFIDQMEFIEQHPLLSLV